MYDILIENASIIDAKGIFHVIVNGKLVIHEATHSGARPGRILKID